VAAKSVDVSLFIRRVKDDCVAKRVNVVEDKVSWTGVTNLKIDPLVPINNRDPTHLQPMHDHPCERFLEMQEQNYNVWPKMLDLLAIGVKIERHGSEVELERIGILFLQLISAHDELPARILEAACEIVVIRDTIVKDLV
jgi:hypothetical protein